LSTPKGWLTYSGQFTDISGHPLAVGHVQDRESSLVKDLHSTTEPYNQQAFEQFEVLMNGKSLASTIVKQ